MNHSKISSNERAKVGIACLPNQRLTAVQRSGASFTLMLAGETGLGKTTFLNTLFTLELKKPMSNKKRFDIQRGKTATIELTRAILEEDGFRLKLTIVDTPGFGDSVDNKDGVDPLIDFIDDQHEAYFKQEQQPHRENLVDQRVHACLYFIRPTGQILKPFDIEAMKLLCTRVNLIPVIAKADTLNQKELKQFKERIRDVLDAQSIDVFLPPIDEEDKTLKYPTLEKMPYAIVGKAEEIRLSQDKVIHGRRYPWGIVDIENEHHCDFKVLRDVLLRKHMLDLIKKTEEVLYEQYRHSQMETRKPGEPRPLRIDSSKFKEEEDALRRRFTERVKLEEQRFRNWEQRLITERDRLNKDLETSHSMIKQLEQEIEQLSKNGPKKRKD